MPTYRTSNEVNYGFGQFGNAVVNNDDEQAYSAPSGKNVVAITFLADSTFTSLTPFNSDFIEDPAVTFPAGVTLYGRFSALQLATGTAVVYLGS